MSALNSHGSRRMESSTIIRGEKAYRRLQHADGSKTLYNEGRWEVSGESDGVGDIGSEGVPIAADERKLFPRTC